MVCIVERYEVLHIDVLQTWILSLICDGCRYVEVEGVIVVILCWVAEGIWHISQSACHNNRTIDERHF